jgi:hypothetical protein
VNIPCRHDLEGEGATAVLDLYDGVPHIFQFGPQMVDAPESKAALKKMTSFLRQHLGG